MITTQQRKIPWLWILLVSLPTFASWWPDSITGNVLLFTMDRLSIKAPALITLIGSLPLIMYFSVGPYVAWKSDRIWTRYGRRRPFVVPGLLGVGVTMAAIPLAPNLPVLIVFLVAFGLCVGISWRGGMQPLMTELVPQPQRGRQTATGIFFGNLGGGLFFSWVLFRRFDAKHLFGISWFSGEYFVYWAMALGTVITALYFHLLIRETPMPPAPGGSKFAVKPFVKAIFGEHQYRMIFLLVFASAVLNSGLYLIGSAMNVMQFGYSKDVLGRYNTIVMLARVFAILPVVGFLADRFARMTLFRITMTLTVIHPMLWWCFIHFVAHNGVPTLRAMFVFDIVGGFLHMTDNCTVGPLIFDHVARDRIGAVCAGTTWVSGMATVMCVNSVGVFVGIYNHFLPQANGRIDYSSGLFCNLMLYVSGVLATLYFIREVKRGRVLPLGIMEHQQHLANVAAEKAAAEVAVEV